jgi:hypothetical protein
MERTNWPSYPDESRPLLDYDITGGGPNMRVDVIYSLSPEELAQQEQNAPRL